MAVRWAILPPVPVPYREPLFTRLAERGRIDPHVIYQAQAQPGWDQRPDWFPRSHAYEARTLRSWQRARPGRSPVVVPRDLGRALRAAVPAGVVSWEFGPTTLRALAWCAVRRRPLLVFSEVTPDADRELGAAQRRLHRLLAPRVAGFVAASSAARRRLLALGVEPRRVEVSLQSAELEPFAAVPRRDLADGARPLRVLAVGRLVADKNLHRLIEAFSDPVEAELVICGSGPLEHELKELAQRRGARVRFAGYTPPPELPALYAEADALALVSTYEPFGAALREGAAAGLPLICSRLAGAAGDIAVEGENAILVDPASEEQIAGAVRRLAADGALRERLAAGSRVVTERTPLEADVEAFERALLRAAGAGS